MSIMRLSGFAKGDIDFLDLSFSDWDLLRKSDSPVDLDLPRVAAGLVAGVAGDVG